MNNDHKEIEINQLNKNSQTIIPRRKLSTISEAKESSHENDGNQVKDNSNNSRPSKEEVKKKIQSSPPRSQGFATP